MALQARQSETAPTDLLIEPGAEQSLADERGIEIGRQVDLRQGWNGSAACGQESDEQRQAGQWQKHADGQHRPCLSGGPGGQLMEHALNARRSLQPEDHEQTKETRTGQIMPERVRNQRRRERTELRRIHYLKRKEHGKEPCDGETEWAHIDSRDVAPALIMTRLNSANFAQERRKSSTGVSSFRACE